MRMSGDWGLIADLEQLFKCLDDENDGNQRGERFLREARDQRNEGGCIGGDQDQQVQSLTMNEWEEANGNEGRGLCK